MRIILTVSLLLSVWLLVACHSTPDSGGAFEPFRGAVDSTRLDERLEWGSVSLLVPRGWVADSVTHSRQNPATGSRLSSEQVAPAGDFAPWARSRVAVYRAEHPRASISEQWLRIHEAKVVEVVAVDSAAVSFQLWIDAPRPILLSYTVPQAAMAADVRAVESSIGSLGQR